MDTALGECNEVTGSWTCFFMMTLLLSILALSGASYARQQLTSHFQLQVLSSFFVDAKVYDSGLCTSFGL